VAAGAADAAVQADAADSVEEQQDAEAEATVAQADAEPETAPEAPSRPPAPARPGMLTFSTPAPEAPAPDAYSLRLVATRKLYDQGTATHHSPSLSGLGTANAVRMHPHDFDRLGIDAGATVTLTAATGAIKLPAVPDSGVPKGSAAVLVNQAGPVVGTLIDASARVTDIKVERA
jgi:anaerobic selenocysteine-containing dehydrogenase